MKLFPIALLATTATASLCIDYQTGNDQVLLAVQPCGDSVSDIESQMSIFVRAASGKPEALLAESLKQKLDDGDFAGYLSAKLGFDTDEPAVNVKSAFAIAPRVELKSVKKYEIQKSASLEKRDGCGEMKGGFGLSKEQRQHYRNVFTKAHVSTKNKACVEQCAAYLEHIYKDGYLHGSFYYTYNKCKFRSQNNWNGKTSNTCRAGAFYLIVIDYTWWSHQVTGWVDGVDYKSPRICMSSLNSCSSSTPSDGNSICY